MPGPSAGPAPDARRFPPDAIDRLPELPATYHRALDAALAALGVQLTDEARVAIDDHVRLLVAWNPAINLTAIREPAEIAVRHIADSLAALQVVMSVGANRFLDLGSGGGYPAIPLAAAAPIEELLLVDSIAKKVRFLDAARVVLGRTIPRAAGWRTAAIRAEALARDPAHRGGWPLVTARAVASLADLIELSFPLLEPGGVLVAWKSGDPDDQSGFGAEIAAAARAIAAIAEEPSSLDRIRVHAPRSASQPDGTDALAAIAQHRIVVVERGRAAIDDRWPRDPAERRRRHWG